VSENQVDLIAFSPHPDDVELACGGTVLKMGSSGHATAIVDLTAGELGSSGSSATRMEESRKAAEILGVTFRSKLHLPDGGLNSHSRDQLLAVVEAIRRHRPALVLAPYWEARHPDHREASRLIEDAFFLSGLARLSTEHRPYRPAAIFFYMCRVEFSPTFIVDVSDTFERKLEAIAAYESQFSRDAKEAVPTSINDPGFLERIKLRSRYFGSQIGVEHGEPFLSRHPVGVDDIFKLRYKKEERV